MYAHPSRIRSFFQSRLTIVCASLVVCAFFAFKAYQVEAEFDARLAEWKRRDALLELFHQIQEDVKRLEAENAELRRAAERFLDGG